MEIWQTLLQKGNHSFNHESWDHAETYYHQAVSCLEQRWQVDIDDMELMLAWICACHNLAVLYEVQNKPTVALRYLQIPHLRMTDISQQQEHSESTQVMALQSLNITLAPLLAFSQKYPTCDNCVDALKKIALRVSATQAVLH